jgi:uncharacterized protein (DUF1800 family)
MAPTVLPPLDSIDPAEAWQPWKPDAKDPFDLKWAAHLYRRATFGGSPAEVKDAVEKGLPATLDLLLGGKPDADELEKAFVTVGKNTAGRGNQFELRAWWIYCMLNSSHPLREKMVLFWHNHFATSINKVQRTQLMFNQNRLIREHALGKFGPFLQDMSKDAAMIVWLDNNSNLKNHPNENYAREVMELFSLGVGHYTETDIREAARAFTGWHTNGADFDFNARFHDDGDKTVLENTGAWNGDDVIRILLKRADCAEFLCRKVYRNFVAETQEAPAKLIAPLAESFRKSDYDVAALLRTVLSSKHFFSAHAFRQRIKSPVEFVLGAVRSVVAEEVAPQSLVGKVEVMGQQLFAPPNVKGWPGGQAWLNTSTVLARVNFAQSLIMGKVWDETGDRFPNPFAFNPPDPQTPPGAVMPEEPAPPEGRDVARLVREAKATKAEDVVRVLVDVFVPGGVADSARAKLVAFTEQGKPTGEALDRRVRETAHAILSMPDYQLA